MKALLSSGFAVTAALTAIGTAVANPPHHRPSIIRIGEFSSQISPKQARVGVHIGTTSRRPGKSVPPRPRGQARIVPTAVTPAVLTLASNSPLLQNPHPMGPGTLWYQGPPGEPCVYLPTAAPLCFRVVGPNGGGLDPSLVAAAVARSMDLVLPSIEASPSASRSGLSGATTWFWLAGAPSRRTAAVRLGAESVRVSADPSATSWSFGDGVTVEGGAGVAYRSGPPPAEAITHVYEVRCLPGDQGRNPNVLASCGGDGYRVVARVRWTISFTATGPVAASGALPARTTESELAYPVSEARAFLVGGSS